MDKYCGRHALERTVPVYRRQKDCPKCVVEVQERLAKLENMK